MKYSHYPIRLFTDINGSQIDWVAEFIDLPGCSGIGNTPESAISDAIDAKESWMEAAEKQGFPIPEPSSFDAISYSGKFNLRIPKTLHRDLALKAAEDNVSLNLLCTSYLSAGLERSKKKNEDSTKIQNVKWN